jgi:molybdopterin molybdotransferase
VKKRAEKRYFLRSRITRSSDGRYSVTVSGNQSSALLTSMHRGNCLISLPEGESLITEGTEVLCIRLDMEEGTA